MLSSIIPAWLVSEQHFITIIYCCFSGQLVNCNHATWIFLNAREEVDFAIDEFLSYQHCPASLGQCDEECLDIETFYLRSLILFTKLGKCLGGRLIKSIIWT